MKAVFLNNDEKIKSVYSAEVIKQIKNRVELYPGVIKKTELEEHRQILKDVDIIFSTWGMPALTGEEIDDYFPSLKAVFYAAGSVRGFAKPFLERGIIVTSAWVANGIPVAEMTTSMILLANKGFFGARCTSLFQRDEALRHHRMFIGNYGVNVGILGAGTIGKRVIRMLSGHQVNIKCYDPFLSEEEAKTLGVKLCSIDEVFRTCLTVSNHMANNEKTRGMIDYRLLSLMAKNATFINTGRGAQVIEDDLIRVLKENPHMTALLDVTYPEPPPMYSSLYALPNVYLTPHIAGSSGMETYRMGEYAYAEFDKFISGKPLEYSVTLEMLKTMA